MHEILLRNSISSEEELSFRSTCEHFLIKLIKELQQRLPKNLKILKQIRVLSTDECLRVRKESLVPLLDTFCVDPITSNKIKEQWANLLIVKSKESVSTKNFWCKVSEYKDPAGDNPYHKRNLKIAFLNTLKKELGVLRYSLYIRENQHID